MRLDPIIQFEEWYRQRHKYGLQEPDACYLATCKNGKASVRVVLLKHYDDSGYYFVTNYRSAKAKELAENSWATLLFYYDASGRQIKIAGHVKKAEPSVSDAFFRDRPWLSRLASWASNQSSPMTWKYQILVKMIKLVTVRRNVKKRPDFWGAYILVPEQIEFFEHNKYRMNNRTLYERIDGKLQKTYLYP